MVKLVIALIAFVFFSCAPRFTVYIEKNDKINTDGVVILSIEGVLTVNLKPMKS